MSEWPSIEEPELLERLAMSNEEFEAFVWGVADQMPPREYDQSVFAQAVGYPWVRPAGSYLLEGEAVALLAEMSAAERDRVIEFFSAEGCGRQPVLAIGSNAAPEALVRKFAHFPEAEDRAVLAVTGRLHDFDVGVAPQPTLYGAMPATLFPSPGTEVQTTILWVTPSQFTQLTWSEFSYRLGRLRSRFEVAESDASFDEVLVFVSRFGTFAIDGQPVALAAVPAVARSAKALTQEELLDVAAALALGPEARAAQLVRSIFEDLGEVAPKIAATVWKSSLRFESDRWTPFAPAARVTAAKMDLDE